MTYKKYRGWVLLLVILFTVSLFTPLLPLLLTVAACAAAGVALTMVAATVLALIISVFEKDDDASNSSKVPRNGL